ncbi:MAG: hypothetical protein WBR24_06220 [Desulfobacterales bacterium]
MEKQSFIYSLCNWMKSVTWSWVFIGCLLGYLLIHPALMVASHLMMQSGNEISLTFNDLITTVISKSFSIQSIFLEKTHQLLLIVPISASTQPKEMEKTAFFQRFKIEGPNGGSRIAISPNSEAPDMVRDHRNRKP